MTKLHHIRQLAAKKESSPGTEITTHDETDLVRVRELTLEVAPQYFERPVHTRSFGYTPRINGNSSATVSFAVELAGHSGNSGSFSLLNVPTWGRLLQACGFAQSPVYFLTVPLSGLTGGPLQHGELLDDGGTATGTLVGTWEDDNPAIELPVRDITGGPYSGTVTGQTSGGSFTAGADKGGTLSGFGWYPDTDSTDTVTLRLYNDGDLIIVYGCRGDVTIDCQSQDISQAAQPANTPQAQYLSCVTQTAQYTSSVVRPTGVAPASERLLKGRPRGFRDTSTNRTPDGRRDEGHADTRSAGPSQRKPV